MNKNELLNYLNGDTRDEPLIIRSYCLDMGKDPNLIDNFITILIAMANYGSLMSDSLSLSTCHNYALDYYCRKFGITLVHDKNGKFIKAF